MRGKQNIQLIKERYHFDVDPRFSTTHDLKISEVMANDKLQDFIDKKLETLERKENMQFPIDFSITFLRAMQNSLKKKMEEQDER